MLFRSDEHDLIPHQFLESMLDPDRRCCDQCEIQDSLQDLVFQINTVHLADLHMHLWITLVKFFQDRRQQIRSPVGADPKDDRPAF